jgi:hypothetical protein
MLEVTEHLVSSRAKRLPRSFQIWWMGVLEKFLRINHMSIRVW